MSSIPFQAFTYKFPTLVNKLVTHIAASLPYNPKTSDAAIPQPPILKCEAIWDTGAEASVITKEYAAKLGLTPISKKMVYGVGDPKVQNVYLINIYLPNNVVVHHVEVTECEMLLGGYAILVGMDIIRLGDFSVTNDGFTMLSFRMPSVRHVDYVEKYNREREQQGIQAQRAAMRLGYKEAKARKKLARKQSENAVTLTLPPPPSP